LFETAVGFSLILRIRRANKAFAGAAWASVQPCRFMFF
jgi:hypothetical protein